MQRTVVFASLVSAVMLSSAARAVDLRIEPIQVPGADSTEVFGINNHDVAVGTFYNPQRGFLRDAKNEFTTLEVMGGDTVAFGINDAGDVVGTLFFSKGYKLDSAGNLTIIDVPDASATQAWDINNSGTIVGFIETPTGVHGFLRDRAGHYTIVDPPDATSGGGFTGTFATGINDAGETVGHYENTAGVHGFLRDAAGNYTTLDVPGENVTEAFSINNRGDIVGFFWDQAGGIPSGVHGFLRDRWGKYTILDVPGAPETRLLGINDRRTIVGQYVDASGQAYSFLAQSPLTGISIDVKPGSPRNSINPRSNGVIPVAILTTTTFDATTVDPASVRFGPGQAVDAHGRGQVEDVDGDGDLDLVAHFRTQDSGIACGAVSVCLTGTTSGGVTVEGCDSVVTVGCQSLLN